MAGQTPQTQHTAKNVLLLLGLTALVLGAATAGYLLTLRSQDKQAETAQGGPKATSTLPRPPKDLRNVSGTLVGVRGETLSIAVSLIADDAMVRRTLLGVVTEKTRITEIDPAQVSLLPAGERATAGRQLASVTGLAIGDTINITADRDVQSNAQVTLLSVERFLTPAQ